jgi:hypothetical protein
MRRELSFSSLVLLLLASACEGPLDVSVAETEPRSGLVALWAGEGDTNDSLGLHHGLSAGGSAFVPGRSGHALQLSGDTVRVAGAELPVLTRSTIDFWIRPDETIDRSLAKTVFVCSRGPYSTWTGFENGTGRFEVRLPIGTSLFSTRTEWRAGQWHRITVTFDGATHVLYVDGSAEASASGGKGMLANDNDLLFGHPSAWFAGAVDEVAVYDRALEVYELPPPEASRATL